MKTKILGYDEHGPMYALTTKETIRVYLYLAVALMLFSWFVVLAVKMMGG